MKQGNSSMVCQLRGQSWAAWVIIGLAFFAGCESLKSDSEWDCDTIQVDLTLDEDSSLGFPPADLLETIEGSRTATLTWVDGTTTEFNIELTGTGSARELRKKPRGVEHAPDDLLEWCVSLVVVDAFISMRTADGVLHFNTTHSVASRVTDEGELDIPINHLQSPDGDGTFIFDPNEWREVSAYIKGKVTADTISGKITEYAEKYDAESLDESGFVQAWETIATF